MELLKTAGKYTVSDEIMAGIKENFLAGFATEDEVKATIKETFNDGYLADTHTAVAINVFKKLVSETPTVIASTASPYKFPKSVLSSIIGTAPDMDEFDMTEELSRVSGTKMPIPLSGLKNRPVRFTSVSEVEDMQQCVYDMLGI